MGYSKDYRNSKILQMPGYQNLITKILKLKVNQYLFVEQDTLKEAVTMRNRLYVIFNGMGRKVEFVIRIKLDKDGYVLTVSRIPLVESDFVVVKKRGSYVKNGK